MINICTRNLEAERQALEIERDSEAARLDQQRDIEVRRAMQRTEVARQRALGETEAEQAQISAREMIEKARIANEQAVSEARIAGERDVRQREIERTRAVEEIAISARETIDKARIAIQRSVDAARIASEREVRQREIERTRTIEEAEIQAREYIEKARIEQERAVTESRIVNEEETRRREIARSRAVDEAEIEAREATEKLRIVQMNSINAERIAGEERTRSLEIARTRGIEEAEIAAGQAVEAAKIARERRLAADRIAAEQTTRRLEIVRNQVLEEAGISAREATIGEAAAALLSDRGARYLGGGTLVMRALNEGDVALSTIVRVQDRGLKQIRATGGGASRSAPASRSRKFWPSANSPSCTRPHARSPSSSTPAAICSTPCGRALGTPLSNSVAARADAAPARCCFVAHTHLHIDHAGKDDLFPMNSTVVVNRKELEYSVSGLQHPQYPAPDIKHLIDRLHTRHALRLLDLEISGPIELMPGVYCEAAGAHTEGSMNIHVHTAEGVATICGDVLYDINDQLVEPFRQTQDAEPQMRGNHGLSKRAEKGAIKKLLANARFLLPVHDRPCKVEGGVVTGRLQDQVPGPIVQSYPKRQWFPA